MNSCRAPSFSFISALVGLFRSTCWNAFGENKWKKYFRIQSWLKSEWLLIHTLALLPLIVMQELHTNLFCWFILLCFNSLLLWCWCRKLEYEDQHPLGLCSCTNLKSVWTNGSDYYLDMIVWMLFCVLIQAGRDFIVEDVCIFVLNIYLFWKWLEL